jgi:hypothetical protein
MTLLSHKTWMILISVAVAAAVSFSCSLDWTPAGDGFTDGAAVCPSGLSPCGGLCVNLSYDHENCGSCGNACAPEEVCSDGECILECPDGKTRCSGGCVDTDSDIYNCGECDNACEAGLHAVPVCSSGTCSVQCEEGWFDPDGDGSCDSNCDPTADEICNGSDDDCDGFADEDFECVRGDTETGGTCEGTGYEERTCLDDCTWSPWECIGGGDCTPGETKPCGLCGTQTCDASGVWGSCLGVGDCEPGTTQSCEYCGTRTCGDDCYWGGCIGGGECNPGATESCGPCGTRTCLDDCTWGICVNSGDCEPGETQDCGNCGTKTCLDDCTWGSCTDEGDCRPGTTQPCAVCGQYYCGSDCRWMTDSYGDLCCSMVDDNGDTVPDSDCGYLWQYCSGCGSSCCWQWCSYDGYWFDCAPCS